MKNPIIVYNTSYNGLSIIQEFGSKGYSCFALDSKYSVGAFSRYAKFRKCPNPIHDEKAFIDFLYNLCAKQSAKPILFPTNDEWALVTAKYKQRLSEVALPCVASFETVNTLLSKDLFYQIGQQRQYLTPYTWSVKDLESISKNHFPIVAKPKYKTLPAEKHNQQLNRELKKIRLVILNDKEELHKFCISKKRLLEHVVFQEYVLGNSDTMFTVGIYADSKHEIKALFTGRKVRGYPADIGDNILGESHEVPSYLIENTEKIVKELSYEGIAEFEYKLNSITREFRLIEVNPRPWSWIGITPYCNVNIPFIAYESLLGKEMELTKSDAKNGEVKYIKIFQDFFNCMVRYRFNYKPWHLSYKSWKSSIKAKKIVVAEWHKKDWGIALASIPYLIGKIFLQKWHI
ncbi:Predicted ATP-dependent carboligase, ATP-grasp superfamily [Tangfeifania diversioriginum]|uniref:Predicted ATP-dependent carboligase, ATP-grasp superfamily n=1 Tax=Tangfeifania diversioriginum TaxID=1168035 RepID=A0A1M6NN91_9BACT|nr:ATP-grasp domain-containing protein [Tangfeifania diversioriginum]SHJ97128.1 Predicted ATP-dependent carboligase, ATP-grasp superfamily [Tangfeifania diversioriginum]